MRFKNYISEMASESLELEIANVNKNMEPFHKFIGDMKKLEKHDNDSLLRALKEINNSLIQFNKKYK